ncbi:hypothetical protein A3O17_05640 [Ligilactobacillus aviarius]|uniref:restriction endonuclease subunit S n=1 Tax=Ligilactobacillus aviarius TaxID=1606 RepID=UPI0007D9AE90|nr:restriction endonuclease subunit S [Ligilactobacillus aviarius]OAQ07549.1 hypothetical protein A3O15_00965 [Ligilactobacillus aviarius]OAS76198.1 hypothetical protein A3O17_05640 [Ligilactobacillus aviarius]
MLLLATKVWEQRKLGDIFSKIRNAFVGKVTDYYVDRGFIYLESNNIKNGGINLNTKKYINNEFYYQQKEKWLHTNDIVMVQSGDVGQTAVIPSNLNNTAAHALIMFQEIDSNINPYFLNYQFQSYRCIKQIQIISKGNTVKHVLASDMKEFTVFLASLKEQINVADFLNKLNRIIDLYERKVKLLLQIKKYLLNNLFSEKEYPDLRFKYSKKDNWKKISLSSVLTYKNGKAHEKEINNKGNLDLVMMNSITTEGRLITKKKIFSPQDTLSKNDIVIVLSDIAKGELIGKSSVIPCDDQYVLNQRIGCLRPTSNIDSFFVSKYINQKSQYFKSHAAGTSQINLSKSDVLNCTIYIPNIDEQHYVSNFIINIEKNINFYKDKKQCFIEIKNTLLNNMFI